jgi:hypothetical protein
VRYLENIYLRACRKRDRTTFDWLQAEGNRQPRYRVLIGCAITVPPWKT